MTHIESRITLSGYGAVLTVVALSLAAASLAQTPAVDSAPKRVALVISNSEYVNAKDVLTGPARDRKDLEQVLERLQFTVITRTDMKRDGMLSAVRDFKKMLKAAGPTGIGMIYYAGHASANASGSDNFLLPVDVASVAAADVTALGLPVSAITDSLRELDARAAIMIVIDACRTSTGDISSTSAQPKSAPVPERFDDEGFLVAYSTSEGESARDAGKYARTLMKFMETDGLTIDEVFEQTDKSVAAESIQAPVHRSTLQGKVCLLSCRGVGAGDPITILKAAIASRPTGDVGQVTAAEQIVREGKSLSGLDLKGVYLGRASLVGADFRNSALQEADFTAAMLAKADLTSVDARFIRLANARLASAKAAGALLYFLDGTAIDMRDADAPRSNWLGGSLRGANFRGARLANASFFLADLRDADFTDADLTGASLSGALIAGAKFTGARTANLDISGAIGNTAQFTREQQATLCASEGRGTTIYLRRRTPLHIEELANEFAGLKNSRAFADPCAQDIPNAEGQFPAFKGKLQDYLTVDLWRDNSDGPQRDWLTVERFKATFSAADEVRKAAPLLQVAGRRHQALLSAMRASAAHTKLESTPFLDETAAFLYAVRFEPSIQPIRPWDAIAEEWLHHERHPQEGTQNRWNLFFPPQMSPFEISADVVDLYKQWTVGRAAAFPATSVLRITDIGGLRLPAWRAARAGDRSIALKPLLAISCKEVQINEAVSAACADGNSIVLASRPLPNNGQYVTILKFPKHLGEYAAELTHEALQETLDRSIGMQARIGIAGSRTIVSGSNRLQTLSAELWELHMLTDKGDVIHSPLSKR